MEKIDAFYKKYIAFCQNDGNFQFSVISLLSLKRGFTAALKATRIEMSEAEKKQFMAQHIKTMQMSIAPDGEVVLSFKHK